MRFPSKRQLLEMSANDRSFRIEYHYDKLKNERAGIVSGYIMPWGGKTKATILRSCNRKIQHVETVAEDLKVSLSHLQGQKAA